MPFSVFLDPVNIATHLYKLVWAWEGISNLMALFALILFKSLAMPDRAWAIMTQATVKWLGSTSNIDSAIICMAKPMFIVRFKPNIAPNHPPSKLVITPNTS